MGKAISLFSGYSQKENRVTNYTLLILKMLYEENPKFLDEVLASIIGEATVRHVGVTFLQQEGKGATVPDGLIVQRALTIYIETKNWDWFYDEQLEGHLQSLDSAQKGEKILLALGNFEAQAEDQVYLCPTIGGAYSHQRARYFGMYRGKRVELVSEVEAVVDVDLASGTSEIN